MAWIQHQYWAVDMDFESRNSCEEENLRTQDSEAGVGQWC